MPDVENLLLDSSIIVKWFANEDDSDQAIQLVRAAADSDIGLAATDLAFIETSNTLRYKKGLSSEDIHQALNALGLMRLTVLPMSSDALHEAIDTAFESGITFYDAYHVAHADLRGLRFVTADAALARSLRGATDVVTLDEWSRRHRE